MSFSFHNKCLYLQILTIDYLLPNFQTTYWPSLFYSFARCCIIVYHLDVIISYFCAHDFYPWSSVTFTVASALLIRKMKLPLLIVIETSVKWDTLVCITHWNYKGRCDKCGVWFLFFHLFQEESGISFHARIDWRI